MISAKIGLFVKVTCSMFDQNSMHHIDETNRSPFVPLLCLDLLLQLQRSTHCNQDHLNIYGLTRKTSHCFQIRRRKHQTIAQSTEEDLISNQLCIRRRRRTLRVTLPVFSFFELCVTVKKRKTKKTRNIRTDRNRENMKATKKQER